MLLLLPPARVALGEHAGEVGSVNTRVDLDAAEFAVPRKPLKQTDVGAVAQHMGGAGVAKPVESVDANETRLPENVAVCGGTERGAVRVGNRTGLRTGLKASTMPAIQRFLVCCRTASVPLKQLKRAHVNAMQYICLK